jgi:hypothetical protein
VASAAAPGGASGVEELVLAVGWAQLGLHAKPCVLVNTANYWDGLLEFLDSAVDAGFLKAANRGLLHVVPSAGDAVELIAARCQPC